MTVEKGVTLAISCVFQFFCLFLTHLIITKVGMIYVKAETMRIGNDAVLNNMHEGVVILSEKNDKVLFVNTSA